jgi:hypothetical protein
MKLRSGYKKLLVAAVIILVAVISIIVWDKKRMWDYYSDADSFRSGSGVVTYICRVEEDEKIVLAFSDIEQSFHDNCFDIEGENYHIVMENGILEKLSLGDSVQFVGSPRVFGDGYVLPLIGLSVEGQVLLDPAVGYSNFLDWLRADLIS